MATNSFIQNVYDLFGNSLNSEHVQDFMEHISYEQLGIILEGLKVAYGQLPSFEIEFSLLGSQYLTDSNLALTIHPKDIDNAIQICYVDEELLDEYPRLSVEGYNVGDIYLATLTSNGFEKVIQFVNSTSFVTASKTGFYNLSSNKMSFC